MKERGNVTLRRLDRWIGIPIIAALSLLRRKRTAVNDHFTRSAVTHGHPAITLLKSAAIGDTVLLSAIVRDLRTALPDCKLRLACGTSNLAVAKMIVGVDEVVVLPMSKPYRLWRVRRQLRSDILIDFDSWPRINALISFGSGSTTTVGFRTKAQFRHFLYDRVAEHSTSIHEVENYRQLVLPIIKAAGKLLNAAPKPWLNIPSAGTYGDAERKVVIFHMFAGGSQAAFKEWPVDRWASLARDLSQIGFQIRLSGSGVDVTRNREFARLCAVETSVTLLPVMELAALADLLKNVAVVVSVDTGIAHLAGAAGARTVVLHGPTSPDRWGVLGTKVCSLKDSQKPWIQLGFETTAAGEPVQLSTDEVRHAVLSMVTQ